MAKKTFVVDEQTGQQMPFLRGILVQSLAAAGLDFQQAYETASVIRDQLSDLATIATHELRDHVADELEQRFGTEVRRSYEAGGEPDILIRTQTREAPFSVGILSRYLEGCAIGRDEALEGARRVYDLMNEQGITEIDHRRLRGVIFDALRDCCSETAVQRYLCRRGFENSGDPLIVLVGGTSGAGKSTVTAELAYRLGIVRTQSTDMMREIIRCYLAPHVVPTLGYSSFEAWRGLPEIESIMPEKASDSRVVTGFLSQFGAVKAALEAAIERAVKEQQDLIVDGVHVLSWKLKQRIPGEGAMIVPVVLAVTNRRRLSRQLARRSRETPGRASSRHKKSIEEIWELQSYMLNAAEMHDVPIVANFSVDDAVQTILEEVIQRIAEHYPPSTAALEEGENWLN